MILHPPEITYQNNTVEISARVTFIKPTINRLERLWFRYPVIYSQATSGRSDPFVVGAALALDRLIRIYYIPSSYSLRKPKPLEAWPYLYNLLSTETLVIYHDGAPYSRFEKTAALTGWQPAKNFLRVCVNRQKRFGVRNCSTCEKCRRTLTMIKLTGKTEDFKTFRQPYRWFDLLRWFPMYDDAVPIWIKQMTRHAWVSRQYVVLPLLLFSHLCGLARFWLYQCIPGNIYHQLKTRFFPPEKDPFNPCHLTPDQQ